jgi:hypothetical protein
MSYATEKLLTAAECDQALNLANARKDDLQFEQTVQGRTLNNQSESIALANAKLVAVTAEITGQQAALATLPEGHPNRKAIESKIRRLNDQKENLEERLESGGNATLLDDELDAGLIRAQIAEIDTYVSVVNTRKAALT